MLAQKRDLMMLLYVYHNPLPHALTLTTIQENEASYSLELAEERHSIQNLRLSELHEHPAINFLAVLLKEQLDLCELKDHKQKISQRSDR